jgi:hypothetical protein
MFAIVKNDIKSRRIRNESGNKYWANADVTARIMITSCTCYVDSCVKRPTSCSCYVPYVFYCRHAVMSSGKQEKKELANPITLKPFLANQIIHRRIVFYSVQSRNCDLKTGFSECPRRIQGNRKKPSVRDARIILWAFMV